MKDHKCYAYVRNLWLLAFIDFFSKSWAVSHFKYPVCFNSFLSFNVVYNYGISWSMFASSKTLVFVAITLVSGFFLFYFSWYAYQRRMNGYCTYAETLVIVGGTANFIDRLYHKAVVDFIQISWGSWTFPIFNIADICIVAGVCIMLLQTMTESES